MRNKTFYAAVAAVILAHATSMAQTYYVSINGNDSATGTSWTTAKRTIQAAVDIPGAVEIVVTNGTYESFASANKAVTIRSVNGAADTIISGGGANRCATLGDSGQFATVLSAFTLASGFDSSGGGALGGTLLDCVFTNNTAAKHGGGAYASKLTRCTLAANNAELFGGGGAYDCEMEDCVLFDNTAPDGGGAYRCSLTDCTLSGNTAQEGGGGAYGCNLYSCTLTGNTARYGGGACDCEHLENCLLSGNTALEGGGAFKSTLANCTLSGNIASIAGGGIYSGTLVNCIVWGNTSGDNVSSNYVGSTSFSHSCAAPDPGGSNIGTDPRFADAENGDFRLLLDSPCIDAGDTASAQGATDLDGNPRVLDAAVDMGAHETIVVYYVDVTRPDDSGDGLSWPTAKKNIQAAVNIAFTGRQIHVEKGTYFESIITSNRTITILGVNGAAATRIDGGGANRCATLDIPPAVGTNTLLSGFTLQNGRAGGSGYVGYAGYGGGAYAGTLRDCVLTNNTATHQGGGTAYSTLTGCTLSGNTADSGGGSSFSTLTGCTLSGNTAQHVGGGSYDSTLTGCTLSGNTADYGGGSCAGTLTGCGLSGNTAYDYGGGSYSSTLTDCTLKGNTAKYGGGYAGWDTLTRCVITDNAARLDGGGVWSQLPGGEDWGDLILLNCLVTHNEAGGDGGGAWNATLFNCTLSKNTADEHGGGVRECTLYNCIAVGNVSRYLADFDHSESYFTFSCTSDLLPAFDGGGNIGTDPLFADAATGDFRLLPASPCVDAGTNEWVVGATDLDGNTRITYGGRVRGPKVDMGCYELPQYLTSDTPVPVPFDWFDEYFDGLETPQDYEDAANAPGANDLDVWESYYAGLDPTNPDSRLRITAIEAQGGVCTLLEWFPDLRSADPARAYEIGTAEILTTPAPLWLWMPPGDIPFLAPTPTRFFKVRLIMPSP